jgi:hypothetical protein
MIIILSRSSQLYLRSPELNYGDASEKGERLNVLYPDNKTCKLTYYAQFFNTVEMDATFYNPCSAYPLDKISLSIHYNSNQNNRYRNSTIKSIYNKECYKTFQHNERIRKEFLLVISTVSSSHLRILSAAAFIREL